MGKFDGNSISPWNHSERARRSKRFATRGTCKSEQLEACSTSQRHSSGRTDHLRTSQRVFLCRAGVFAGTSRLGVEPLGAVFHRHTRWATRSGAAFGSKAISRLDARLRHHPALRTTGAGHKCQQRRFTARNHSLPAGQPRAARISERTRIFSSGAHACSCSASCAPHRAEL